MNTTGIFRVRFRFRLLKQLNISAKRYELNIGEHDVVLSAALSDVVISESNWLVMDARGFHSEPDARRFAMKLKGACELSSVASRLGVDAGVDAPTSSFGSAVKEYIREQSGILLRHNIHGIDVFQDESNVRIGDIRSTGTILTGP